MKKSIAILLFFCIALFGLLYLGFDKVPKDIKQAEKSRVFNFEKITVSSLIEEALKTLPEDGKSFVVSSQAALAQASSDSTRIGIWKNLSGFWYQENQRAIAAHYAEEVAKTEDDVNAWSIAGTSYVLCSQAEEGDLGEYCRDAAVRCFENAISLDPENVDHKINLALSYVYRPLQDNPMKGILLLRDLNQAHPENASVLMQLARLSIQTGQWEKALGRLNTVLSLEPNNEKAPCMLVQVYGELGQADKANENKLICNSFRGN